METTLDNNEDILSLETTLDKNYDILSLETTLDKTTMMIFCHGYKSFGLSFNTVSNGSRSVRTSVSSV